MAENKRTCVIDIGTAHITALIAEIHSRDHIEVLGMGRTKNRGMQQGKILSMDKVVAGIKQVVQYAEDMADCRVHSAWVSVTNARLRSFNCSGRVTLADEHVSTTDVVRTLAKAKQQHLLDDYYLINHIQHGISLDDHEELTADPIKMVASEIEAFYHLMMLPVNVMQNIQQAMHASGIHIERTVMSNLAMSEYALLPEERDYGVCLVDIGAGCTTMSVFYEDKLLLTHCIAVAGDMVTRDIATELQISTEEAERIKELHGNVNISDIDPSKILNIPARQGQPEINISVRELGEIIAARYEEILLTVVNTLHEHGLLQAIERGMVYAGGGAQINGFTRFARKTLDMPAQLATFPSQIHVVPTEKKSLERYHYQTACGVLLYGQSEQFAISKQSEMPEDKTGVLNRVFVRPYQKLVNYFSRVF